MAQQTNVTIDMDKDTLQLAVTSVIEHLSLYPPTEEENTIGYSLGLQVLFDCLRSTLKLKQ